MNFKGRAWLGKNDCDDLFDCTIKSEYFDYCESCGFAKAMGESNKRISSI